MLKCSQSKYQSPWCQLGSVAAEIHDNLITTEDAETNTNHQHATQCNTALLINFATFFSGTHVTSYVNIMMDKTQHIVVFTNISCCRRHFVQFPPD